MNTNYLPFGTFKPLGFVTASLRTRPSCADPSHPDKTYINCMSWLQTPSTLVVISAFLVLYRGRSTLLTFTRMCVPSNAPRQFYIGKK